MMERYNYTQKGTVTVQSRGKETEYGTRKVDDNSKNRGEMEGASGNHEKDNRNGNLESERKSKAAEPNIKVSKWNVRTML